MPAAKTVVAQPPKALHKGFGTILGPCDHQFVFLASGIVYSGFYNYILISTLQSLVQGRDFRTQFGHKCVWVKIQSQGVKIRGNIEVSHKCLMFKVSCAARVRSMSYI